jgi:outer membrane cobalamin receptor
MGGGLRSKTLILFALGVPLAVSGQDAPAPAASVHEDVVVTADRAPGPRDAAAAAVSTLSRTEIDALPAKDLGGLIRYLPGFQLYFGSEDGGTPPMLTARGFFGGGDAEYVQVRIDGVPVGDANSGIVDWRALPAERIDRIEAVRGPASPLYGDTALAGVIQVFTRTGEESGATASATAGSFGSAAASAGARFRAGSLGLSAAGSASRTDGFRAHSAEDDEGFALEASRPDEDRTWSFRLSGTGKDRDDPGQLSLEAARADPRSADPLFRFDHEKTDRLRGSIAFAGEGAPVPFRALAYGTLRRTDLVRTLLVAPGLGETAAQSLDADGAGVVLDGRWTAPPELGGVRLRGGAEWSRDGVDSVYRAVGENGEIGERVGAARGNRQRSGAFLAADGDLPRLRLTAGLRWDRVADRLTEPHVSSTHQAWSPQAGAVAFLGPHGPESPSLFVQYSRAFKAATFDQQFDPRPFSDFQGGTFTISNPALEPQRARTWEGGIRVPAASGRIEATAYRIDVEDEIDFDPATYRYRNIGKSRHTGVETLATWTWTRSLSTFASWDATRVESRDGENPGRQLKNVPEHVVRAGVSGRLPAELEAEAVWSWTGRRWLDDENRFRLPDASVVDLRLARRFGDFRVRIDVANLADARYADVGFTLADFSGGEVPYVYPAAGRSVRLGLDWRR